MLIQVHMLQNYAPANLNRDDTGSPKDAIFGGFRRGRISSQCLKRSIRKSEAFAVEFQNNALLGVRTKLLPKLINDELQGMGVDEDTRNAIVARVPDIGRESDKRQEGDSDAAASSESAAEAKNETRQLIFVGQNEVGPLARKLLELYKQHGAKWGKVKISEITKVLGKSTPLSVDIAMFGRMTTSEAFEDVQAAVQVAHALSTNTLTQEFDYYTAVDDISGKSGAGMIGDVEFNSSTYYKYLNVHWEQLVKNLGGDTEVARRAVLALLQAAATAQPTGKQNSFAAHNFPDLILVEVSDGNLPVSYANAFVKPARASGDKSLMDDSVDKLTDYLSRVAKTYGLEARRALVTLADHQMPLVKRLPSLSLLKQWLEKGLLEG